MTEADDKARARPGWRQLAQLGFWFFLIKGLLWLTVPLALAWWAGSDAR